MRVLTLTDEQHDLALTILRERLDVMRQALNADPNMLPVFELFGPKVEALIARLEAAP